MAPAPTPPPTFTRGDQVVLGPVLFGDRSLADLVGHTFTFERYARPHGYAVIRTPGSKLSLDELTVTWWYVMPEELAAAKEITP
jgi:hypothetical protein